MAEKTLANGKKRPAASAPSKKPAAKKQKAPKPSRGKKRPAAEDEVEGLAEAAAQSQDPPGNVQAAVPPKSKAKAKNLLKTQEALQALRDEGLLDSDCKPAAASANPAFWGSFVRMLQGLVCGKVFEHINLTLLGSCKCA